MEIIWRLHVFETAILNTPAPFEVNTSSHLLLFYARHEHKTFIFFSDTPNNSSLPLQMSLFANVYTLPVWIAVSMYYFYIHSLGLNDTYEKVLAIIFFGVASPMEAGRLYLGYSGNLRERVFFVQFSSLGILFDQFNI